MEFIKITSTMVDKISGKYFKRNVIYLALLITFLCQIRPAGSTGNGFLFLNRIYSPRLSALAGSNNARYGDINGIFINPAGLAYIYNKQICLNYVSHLLDMRGGMLGFHLPISPWGNLSFGIVHFDYGDFEEIDKFGVNTGRNFTAKDMAMGISYSYALGHQFAYAVTAKYIFSELDKYRATAAALDLGLLYRPDYLRGTSFGISLLNAGDNFDPYNDVAEELPLTLSAGISMTHPNIPATLYFSAKHVLNGNNSKDFSVSFSAGSEISVLEKLYLRAGFNHQRNNDLASIENNNFAGFCFGFGLNIDNNSLDYSYSDFGALGMVHHFGVTFNVQKPKPAAKPGKRVPISVIKTLVPPRNIKTVLSKDNLYIAWEAEKGVFYNVYVRHTKRGNWTRINKTPLRKNWIKLKRPDSRGKYEFALTSLKLYIDYAESAMSKPVSIQIP